MLSLRVLASVNHAPPTLSFSFVLLPQQHLNSIETTMGNATSVNLPKGIVLPKDIVLECNSYIDNEDLHALALTCKQFYPLAIARMYESVIITMENAGHFLRTVTESKDCRPLVKSLALFSFEEPPEDTRRKLNAPDRARMICQLQSELSAEELAFDYFRSIIQLVNYKRDFIAMGSLILRLLPYVEWVNFGDDEYSYTKRLEFPWWAVPLRHGRYDHLSELVINMQTVTDLNHLQFIPPSVKTLRLWNFVRIPQGRSRSALLEMASKARLKNIEILEIMPEVPGTEDYNTISLIEACGPLKKLSFGLSAVDILNHIPPIDTKELWPVILGKRESLEEIALWYLWVNDWEDGYTIRPQFFSKLKALTLPKRMLPPHWFESNLEDFLPPTIETFIVHGLWLEERDRMWSPHGILRRFIEARRSNPDTLPRLRYLGFAICDWEYGLPHGFPGNTNEFFGPNVSEQIEDLYGDLLEIGVETSLWIGTRPDAIPHIWPRTSRWYVSQEKRLEISDTCQAQLRKIGRRWGSAFASGFVEETKIDADWESYRDECGSSW